MIEVTEEQKNAGCRALAELGDWQNTPEICAHIYRAMRSREPKPKQTPGEWAASTRMGAMDTKPEPRLSIRETLAKQADAAASAYQPAEELAKSAYLWVDRTKPFSALDEIARSNRRLDALQALVLVLAARSQGYPPGDATLTRLIAELENAK